MKCSLHVLYQYFTDHETAFAPLNVDIESGDLFDNLYSMHEEVGKGRFGIVYRVTEKSTGTRRAAKIIKCIQSKEKEKVNFIVFTCMTRLARGICLNTVVHGQ